jgi:hypothetical protein
MASTGTTTLVLVLLLLLVAAAMIAVAVWLARATRRDPPALAPLEAMGDRTWRRADSEARSSSLAAVRPTGAREPAPMLDYEPAESADPGEADPADVDTYAAQEATGPASSEPVEPGQRDEPGESEGEGVDRYARDDG